MSLFVFSENSVTSSPPMTKGLLSGIGVKPSVGHEVHVRWQTVLWGQSDYAVPPLQPRMLGSMLTQLTHSTDLSLREAHSLVTRENNSRLGQSHISFLMSFRGMAMNATQICILGKKKVTCRTVFSTQTFLCWVTVAWANCYLFCFAWRGQLANGLALSVLRVSENQRGKKWPDNLRGRK